MSITELTIELECIILEHKVALENVNKKINKINGKLYIVLTTNTDSDNEEHNQWLKYHIKKIIIELADCYEYLDTINYEYKEKTIALLLKKMVDK